MKLTGKTLLFYLLLLVLGYITYGRELGFSFWKDDWFYLWSVLFAPSSVSAIFLHPHPATSVVFFTLGRLFRENVYLWLQAGIVIRAMASMAVSVMAVRITRSTIAGVLSGIFFVTSSVGLETVSWPSAYVVNIVVIFLCLGIYFWISFLLKRNTVHFVVSIICLFLGIASDPWRALPILVPVYLASVFFSLREKRIMNYELRIMNKRMTVFYSLLGIMGFLLVCLVFWQRGMIVNSQMAIFISRLGSNPGVILEKFYVSGKFFQTLFNLTLGWLVNSRHEVSEVSHATYNAFHAAVGVLTFMVAAAVMLILWRKNSKGALVVAYLVLWIVIFYFPSWFFEPRLIAAYPHRYLVLPSVGFIMLAAYGISQIKNKGLLVITAGLFMFMNIIKVQTTLGEMSVYRLNSVVENVWLTIDKEVMPARNAYVFMYLGDDPAKTNILDLSGVAPFALRRKLRSVSDFPLVTHDSRIIIDFLCSNGPLALERIYAWDIKNSGEMTSVSVRERLRLKGETEKRGCKL